MTFSPSIEEFGAVEVSSQEAALTDLDLVSPIDAGRSTESTHWETLPVAAGETNEPPHLSVGEISGATGDREAEHAGPTGD